MGKSTTAVNLALALRNLGNKVAVLDADIYGPSMPRLLGLKQKPEVIEGKMMRPLEAFGLKVMSIGFLVEEETPMIWRGPMVMSAITQMLREVAWGDVDVMVVDMPPGTGDAQLTMAQSVPLAGSVIVSTPQDLALIDARRGIAMFRRTEVPILGIVENMSTFVCPHCGTRSDIFAHGGAQHEAERLGVPYLGEVPLAIPIRETSDAGRPIVVAEPNGPHAEAYLSIARRLVGHARKLARSPGAAHRHRVDRRSARAPPSYCHEGILGTEPIQRNRGRCARETRRMREAIGRRGFIAGAALGATALATGPTRAAGADPEVTWRLTSSFPKSLDLLYGGAEAFAREVGQITDGRFRIDVSPPGDIVPGLQAFDAVQAGTVEACQTSLDYEYGKDPAFAIPTAFPFGMNARQQTAFALDGGGNDLTNAFPRGLRRAGLSGRQHRGPDGRLLSPRDQIRRRSHRAQDQVRGSRRTDSAETRCRAPADGAQRDGGGAFGRHARCRDLGQPLRRPEHR